MNADDRDVPDTTTPLISLRDVAVEYQGGVRAVAGVSFDVARGETVSIVGESGCGKSSLARAIVHAPPPTEGSVHFEGTDLGSLSSASLRQVRPRLQMIFQDPISSLNPRRTARQIVAEGPTIWSQSLDDDAVDETLRTVGIDPEHMGDRRPHQFSGGQCQRISIARAIIMRPELIVCDEPVSALDVSVQAQVLNLLRRLRSELGLTMIFIAHDLAVVKNISDRVAVMYLGRICEIGRVEDIFDRPRHHYTLALLAAVPEIDAAADGSRHARDLDDVEIDGEVPSPSDPPSGCRFRTRCPRAEERCSIEEPTLRETGDGHAVACHFPVDDVTA